MMESKTVKIFLTRCDEHPEGSMVSSADCSACPHGSVVDNRSRVLCYGATKFYSVPCFHEMRAAATVADCDACHYGTVSEDRMRVFCNRL